MNIPALLKNNDRIILFDGLCHLCSGFMLFVYKRDRADRFKFAWLQDEKSKKILEALSLSDENLDTIILIEYGMPYYKSTAVIKIFRYIRFPWPVLSMGVIVPRSIRDRVYDWVAKRRYDWFGKKDQCLIPDNHLMQRFL